ncbi:MAG: hypothetical protein K8F60_04185 [Melioribacteraceae bacterium]|nr:hypothetical protein [Melioribacteraceae bacterium]
MFIVLTSCDNVTENEIQKEQEKANLGKNIGPLALEYLVKYVYYWDLEKYTPVANKYLGIWPSHNSYLYSIAKDKFGFSKILIYDYLPQHTAIEAGYDSLQIVAMLPHDKNWAQYFVDMYNKVGGYYIDEPIERWTYTHNELVTLANNLKLAGNVTPILLGGYTGAAVEYYKYVRDNTTNTFFMCDKYVGDQRDYWTSWKNHYGIDRLSGNWLHIDTDFSEYQDLLGHANNLGLSQTWVFANGLSNVEAKLYNFADKAWKTNWLLKVERKYRQEYRCYERNCDPEENWQLYETVPLNQFRTITFNQDQE